MTELEYNGFWDNTCIPFIDKILNISKNIYFIENKKKEIFFKYEKIKASIKENEMCNPNGKLDRHKVGAILSNAVILSCPFQLEYKQDVKFTPLEFYANEYFAFHFALSVVYSFLKQDYENKNDKESLSLFQNYNTNFEFPKCEYGAYSDSIIQILNKTKDSKYFDYFMFSNILFMIEPYTKSIRKSLIKTHE